MSVIILLSGCGNTTEDTFCEEKTLGLTHDGLVLEGYTLYYDENENEYIVHIGEGVIKDTIVDDSQLVLPKNPLEFTLWDDIIENEYIKIYLDEPMDHAEYTSCNALQRRVEIGSTNYDVLKIEWMNTPIASKENAWVVETNLHGPSKCNTAYKHRCQKHDTWNTNVIEGEIHQDKKIAIIYPHFASNDDLFEIEESLEQQNLRARVYIDPNPHPKKEKYSFVHILHNDNAYKVIDIEWLGEVVEFTEEQIEESNRRHPIQRIKELVIWENDILEKIRICEPLDENPCGRGHTYYHYKDGRTDTNQLDAVIPKELQDAFSPHFKPYGSYTGPWTLLTPDEDYLLHFSREPYGLSAYNILDGSTSSLMTFFENTYDVSSFMWSPNGEKLAFIAFNESYRHGTKIFVLDIFMGEIDKKQKFDVPIDYSCANICFPVLKDSKGEWINDTDAFKWTNDSTIQYPSYNLPEQTNFLTTLTVE